jgi:hypothetical protein
VIERRIRRRGGGIDLAADVNAVISANVGGKGQRTVASSEQRVTDERPPSGPSHR